MNEPERIRSVAILSLHGRFVIGCSLAERRNGHFDAASRQQSEYANSITAD
jgi:hypothetical protein